MSNKERLLAHRKRMDEELQEIIRDDIEAFWDGLDDDDDAPMNSRGSDDGDSNR